MVDAGNVAHHFVDLVVPDWLNLARGHFGKAVRVDFWGGLHVDPNWVYVSKETAHRSTEALKAFMANRRVMGDKTHSS